MTGLVLTFLFSASAVCGQGWEPIGFPLSEAVTGMSFLSPDTAFVVTSAGSFVRTYNGGKTWVAGSHSGLAGIALEDICFLNTEVGAVCGRRGAIYWTNNGGQKWSDCSVKDTLAWFLSIQLFDARTAVLVGISRDTASVLSGLLYRTTDAGATWSRVPQNGVGFGELFYRVGSPICFQSYGELHFSRDLGATWETRRTLGGKPARATAFFGKSGIIAGNQGACAYSSDGGQNWTSVSMPDKFHFTSAVLVDDKIGYVAGIGPAVFKTTDGGKTWTDITAGVDFDVYELRLVGKKLYAAGTKGGMARRSAR